MCYSIDGIQYNLRQLRVFSWQGPSQLLKCALIIQTWLGDYRWYISSGKRLQTKPNPMGQHRRCKFTFHSIPASHLTSSQHYNPGLEISMKSDSQTRQCQTKPTLCKTQRVTGKVYLYLKSTPSFISVSGTGHRRNQFHTFTNILPVTESTSKWLIK